MIPNFDIFLSNSKKSNTDFKSSIRKFNQDFVRTKLESYGLSQEMNYDLVNDSGEMYELPNHPKFCHAILTKNPKSSTNMKKFYKKRIFQKMQSQKNY